jgi:ubiquinone/menaquinone biosynthesis C-methylase UbiE
MQPSGSHDENRAYYDAFSAEYEAERGDNDPGGYHDLLDELETGFVERFAREKDVLEVGCGTGLLLLRMQRFAKSVRGVDLSPGMLEKAKARGLDVLVGSATELPFGNDNFDVTCSFKVLAHVPEIEKALDEMARVTRPGGVVIAEFYNPSSLRGLAKRLAPPGRIAEGKHEDEVFTRFDSPKRARELLGRKLDVIAARGIRIVTPAARLMKNPAARAILSRLERTLADTALSRFGGFYAVAARKRG